MSCGEFTDDEIREELAHLGYHDVPQDKLEGFKKDLMTLITRERSKSNSLNSSRTTEPESRERDPRQQQFTSKGHVEEEDFTNHGNQWLGNGFHEDWRYQGEKEGPVKPQTISRPQTAPEKHGQQRRERAAEGYSDFELPSSSRAHQERNQSCHRDDESSEAGSESRCMKRKTSRKTSDGCRLIDESFTDTDSGVFEIYERIKNLAMRECECGKSRSKSGDVEPPYRIKGKVNKTPSVIKKLEPPHTRNLVRVDVNLRHQMYQDAWKARPPIGDDIRINLRKSVHTKMLKRDEFKLKQKVFVPNLYVPPHQKLRKDVRWKVKQACESYELPAHGFYHEI